MTISENQLDTWAKQGSVKQSKDTYAIIRRSLESDDAPYADKRFDIFLQGSYGNNTNIYADSDVDIVIKVNSVYYYDVSKLSEAEQQAFDAAFSKASYQFKDFKADVTSHLKNKFPGSVDPGNKAIFVASGGSRRDADVVPVAQFRKYTSFSSASNQQYVEGVCLWNKSGQQIINYPKQHSENCTAKHQGTSSWFKPTVRIFKNMRNSMITRGYLEEDVAPSYFLEGMLYNVPNRIFGGTYQDTVAGALNWLVDQDSDDLVCANEQYRLCHPSSLVTWREDQLHEFIKSAVAYWINEG